MKGCNGSRITFAELYRCSHVAVEFITHLLRIECYDNRFLSQKFSIITVIRPILIVMTYRHRALSRRTNWNQESIYLKIINMPAALFSYHALYFLCFWENHFHAVENERKFSICLIYGNWRVQTVLCHFFLFHNNFTALFLCS